MGLLAHLRKLADDPKYSDKPPADFAPLMGMGKCSAEFLRIAWGHFKKTRRAVTILDVREKLKKERKRSKTSTDGTEDMKVGCVESHFMDSGAFTFWTTAVEWANEVDKKTGKRIRPKAKPTDFYDTPEHWQYLDEYANFVKEHKIGIDLYANVDAIGYPELTYRNQKYLEKEHGIRPVPVVHYPTKLDWLRKYMDEGYELIGLGGLVGSIKEESCQLWIDQCFELVCDQPSRLPKVKLHGFGVTSYDMMIRYPWWSVDSTSWTKIGAFGGLLIPHYRSGKFVFDRAPYLIKTAWESPGRRDKFHILNIQKSAPEVMAIIEKWMRQIGVPLGKMNDDGDPVEMGAITRHTERRTANLLLFEHMRLSLPEWPWPFRSKKRKGFGIV